MRRASGRVGGTLAVVLSSLWALPAAGLVVFGVLLVLSGRESEESVDVEGFAEFVGGGMAVLGLIVLAAAVGGIVLGVEARRGRARAGLAVLFALFAAVSAMFLASAIADESGADPGGIIGFGVNTAACLAVVVLSALARPSPARP